jgi:hypothetical protein
VLPNGDVIAANGARQGRQESVELVQRDFDGKTIWSFDHNEELPTNDGKTIWSLRQHHDWQREDFPAGYYSPESTPARSGANTLVLTHTDRRVPALPVTCCWETIASSNCRRRARSCGSGSPAITSTSSGSTRRRAPRSGAHAPAAPAVMARALLPGARQRRTCDGARGDGARAGRREGRRSSSRGRPARWRSRHGSAGVRLASHQLGHVCRVPTDGSTPATDGLRRTT